MNYFNFHTHTKYCDGKADPEDYVLAAIENRMTALGFSCHSPLPFENGYSIKENNIESYVSEIRSLQEKYKKQINIFLAFEFDYITGLSENIEPLRRRMNADYVIGSVHMIRNKENNKLWFIDGPERNYINGLQEVFDSDIKKAVKAYYDQISEMVSSQKPDIVGHVDKIKMHNKNRFFSEKEQWYREYTYHLLDVIKENGCIVEVNTRGIYKKRCDSLYPGNDILREILKREIPITISSDAHLPQELTAYFDEAVMTLKEIGFKTMKCFSGSSWEDVSL